MLSRPTLRMQAWAKIYRTDFLKDKKIFFNEELSYSEDSEFVIRVLEKAGKVFVSDIPISLLKRPIKTDKTALIGRNFIGAMM